MCFCWRSDNKVYIITDDFTIYTTDVDLYNKLPTELPIIAQVEMIKDHIVSK